MRAGAAAALLAAQLLVLLIVPVLHQAELAESISARIAHVRDAGRADHTERPSRSGHHETACHACRSADVRNTTAASTVRLLALATAALDVPAQGRAEPAAPSLPGSPGPRAPPRA